MTRSTLTIAALCLAAFAGLFAVAVAGTPRSEAAAGAAHLVKWGEYLVTIAACHDCHSPKVDGAADPGCRRPLWDAPDDMAPDAGIRGSARLPDLTAWRARGNSYAANLTPDPETGTAAATPRRLSATPSAREEAEGEQLLPPSRGRSTGT